MPKRAVIADMANQQSVLEAYEKGGLEKYQAKDALLAFEELNKFILN